MNIFYTDESPLICAMALDDKRVNAMIRESAQMLSTAVKSHISDAPYLYKITHVNHPCNKWVRQSRENFIWLVEHAMCLGQEFRLRFGKPHASLQIVLRAQEYQDLFPSLGLTPHANCTDFKHIESTHLAYRHALISKWKNGVEVGRPPKWTLTTRPTWSL